MILHFFSEHVVDLEEYGWAYKISNNLGRFMHGFIPPFVTLFLNFFLLDVITMASAWERNFYHSEFQKSNFKQLAIYVMFSMAIVPGFAITEHSKRERQTIWFNNFKYSLCFWSVSKCNKQSKSSVTQFLRLQFWEFLCFHTGSSNYMDCNQLSCASFIFNWKLFQSLDGLL